MSDRGGAAAELRTVLRLLAAVALLTLIAAPRRAPPRRRGRTRRRPFLQLRIDRVTPDVVTTTSEPVVTVSGHDAQRR